MMVCRSPNAAAETIIPGGSQGELAARVQLLGWSAAPKTALIKNRYALSAWVLSVCGLKIFYHGLKTLYGTSIPAASIAQPDIEVDDIKDAGFEIRAQSFDH